MPPMTLLRSIVLVFAIILSLHYLLTISNEGYGRATSIESIKKQWAGPNPPYNTPIPDAYYNNQGSKANATFVILARNGDLPGVISSMKQMEDRFNKKFNYPYVFLNEEPFSEAFKERVTELTDAKVEFGLVPHEDWVQPPWINETTATAARKNMIKNQVIYGGSVPYRESSAEIFALHQFSGNMCRFNSGFFFRQEILKKYKYYWRVEPDVKFFCDLDYDPFLLMQEQNKVYGFTVSLFEYEATIPTLWNTVKRKDFVSGAIQPDSCAEFIKENPELLPSDNAMDFLSDDGGVTYNRCHFWSNFEIGDLDFWRGEAYMKFFDFLDRNGGFYYERWGDAPVHSIGAALFAKKDQLHFFNDIGYRHEPFQHCPQGAAHAKGKCWCDPEENFDRQWYSCLNKYDSMFS